MRYSHQRESIYRVVMESPEHPTANMVYEALRTEIPKLSLGTVYRNLNQLADAGRLLKIPLADGGCRFDGTTESHSHIICNGCGTVKDVMAPSIALLGETVERETDFHLSSCDVVMHGLCKDCFQSGNAI